MEEVACALCGSDRAQPFLHQRDLTHMLTDEAFTVVRCEACRLLYVNPRPALKEISRYYPNQYFGTPSPPRRYSDVKRWILETFYGYPMQDETGRPIRWLKRCLLWPEYLRRRLIGQRPIPWAGCGRLLDVGCGSGTSTAIFQADGWDVSGLDLNETAVGHARALLGDRVRLGDFQTVRYPDRSFDVVRLSHSLEHMHDPMSALREARRILDTDGYLVVTVPNAGSWEASLFGRWWFPWELPRHLYHFERDTLTRLLKRAGFRIRCLWSGTSPAHFMTSLERVWRNRTGRSLPARRLLERWVVRPFCLMAGHSGRGTELTAIAVKNGDLLQCR